MHLVKKNINKYFTWPRPQTCTSSFISYSWLLTNMMQGNNSINPRSTQQLHARHSLPPVTIPARPETRTYNLVLQVQRSIH